VALAVDGSQTVGTDRPPKVTPVGVSGAWSALGIGVLIAFLGAWVAVVAFVGPEFGYRATASASWQWTTTNWLLHLLPGAVAVLAGLIILGRAHSGSGRGVGFAGLLAALAGAWLILGPSLWPWLEASHAYLPTADAGTSFLRQAGANLAPGILLVAFGSMVLRAAHPGRVRALVGADGVAATAAPVQGPSRSSSEPAAEPTTTARTSTWGSGEHLVGHEPTGRWSAQDTPTTTTWPEGDGPAAE
jgi:hypothetical protein